MTGGTGELRSTVPDTVIARSENDDWASASHQPGGTLTSNVNLQIEPQVTGLPYGPGAGGFSYLYQGTL